MYSDIDHVTGAHILPTKVSESEIHMVAATVGEHWELLAKILGIQDVETSAFSVSDVMCI